MVMAKIMRVARSKRLTIRLSDAEQAEIKTKAEMSGLSDAEYGRRSLLDHQVQATLPQVNREIYHVLALIHVELRKQGTSLHQIAQFAHAQQHLPQESIAELSAVQPSIEKLQAEIRVIQSRVLGKE